MRLAFAGVPIAQVARLMRLTEPELRDRYGWELENGPAVIHDKVMRALRREAGKGKITALMLVLREERRAARQAARQGR
jgi:hypothetical protein